MVTGVVVVFCLVLVSSCYLCVYGLWFDLLVST